MEREWNRVQEKLDRDRERERIGRERHEIVAK